MNIDFFIKGLYKSFNYSAIQKESVEYKKDIKDLDYLHFVEKLLNGGMFFGGSLILYSFGATDSYAQISEVNKTLNKEFGSLFKELFAFGQDIFGNQFCFESGTTNIIFFGIEDGDRKIMNGSFKDWLATMENDSDFYTGYPYLHRWKNSYQLRDDERLCPKIPFIIGGEYEMDNFYTCSFPNYIGINASIAKQIFDLPDGQEIKLAIIPPSNSD